MSIYNKRHFWGRKLYNSKTGLFEGEKTYHSDGRITDWKGKIIPVSKTQHSKC